MIKVLVNERYCATTDLPILDIMVKFGLRQATDRACIFVGCVCRKLPPFPRAQGASSDDRG